MSVKHETLPSKSGWEAFHVCGGLVSDAPDDGVDEGDEHWQHG
jgi:hypothetical protein